LPKGRGEGGCRREETKNTMALPELKGRGGPSGKSSKKKDVLRDKEKGGSRFLFKEDGMQLYKLGKENISRLGLRGEVSRQKKRGSLTRKERRGCPQGSFLRGEGLHPKSVENTKGNRHYFTTLIRGIHEGRSRFYGGVIIVWTEDERKI